MAYIKMEHCYKKYMVGEVEIIANNDINFEIEKGELVIILGSSGAGKSTVLNILGGMDTCDEGKVIIDGVDISKFNAKQLTEYRRNDVGFVFQFYNLVPNLTAKENVELASEIVKDALDPEKILIEVAKNPKILLCDEPTGALDYRTGKQVLKILQDMARIKGSTVIIVTHNLALAPIADRVIKMHDTRVQSITINKNLQSIEDIEY